MGAVLRTATGEDAEFAVLTEVETMQSYAVATWGEWRAAEVRQRAVDNVLAGRTQVIERDGIRVGVLRVERGADFIDLKQIFIRPAFQRQGIGAEVLHRLIREANGAGVPLRLRVLRVNPAQQLYKRLGFTVVREAPEHVYMEYAR
jgi:GNAT superfamily N-acetyltransferase